MLTIFLYIYLNASTDEICAFIVANGGEVCSREDIVKKIPVIGFDPTEIANRGIHILHCHKYKKCVWFVSLPLPLGVSGIQAARLIDIGDTRFYLKNIVTTYGQGHLSCRVIYPVHYMHKEKKVNVILAVEPGDVELSPNVDGII